VKIGDFEGKLDWAGFRARNGVRTVHASSGKGTQVDRRFDGAT